MDRIYTFQFQFTWPLVQMIRNVERIHMTWKSRHSSATFLENQREEAEMRRRVQKKRHETLERGRRAERLMKIKDDRKIRTEILEAARGVVEVPNVETNAQREFKKFRRINRRTNRRFRYYGFNERSRN